MVLNSNENKHIESQLEVNSYLAKLKYSIKNSQASLQFQQERKVDANRDEQFTNRFTVSDLFPNEDVTKVLKSELLKLNLENYIETVKDLRFPKKKEMRVFGKRYKKDVYIKIRVNLLNCDSFGVNNVIFVMSFHYAEHPFSTSDFPYAKK